MFLTNGQRALVYGLNMFIILLNDRCCCLDIYLCVCSVLPLDALHYCFMQCLRPQLSSCQLFTSYLKNEEFLACHVDVFIQCISNGPSLLHFASKETSTSQTTSLRLDGDTYQRQITLRIAGFHFSSRLTTTLNLCSIYLKLLVHVL